MTVDVSSDGQAKAWPCPEDNISSGATGVARHCQYDFPISNDASQVGFEHGAQGRMLGGNMMTLGLGNTLPHEQDILDYVANQPTRRYPTYPTNRGPLVFDYVDAPRDRYWRQIPEFPSTPTRYREGWIDRGMGGITDMLGGIGWPELLIGLVVGGVGGFFAAKHFKRR